MKKKIQKLYTHVLYAEWRNIVFRTQNAETLAGPGPGAGASAFVIQLAFFGPVLGLKLQLLRLYDSLSMRCAGRGAAWRGGARRAPAS